MENISHLLLSDYQRAILNEMGVSSWQLVGEEKSQAKVENQTVKVVEHPSEVISQVDALAKLKKLKGQTQASETTDSVLVTFSQSDTQSQIFTDVLIALGLEAKPQKYISDEKLANYSDYPMSWTQGEKISLKNKQLITPALVELQNSDAKKQLWLHLQSAVYLEKN